MTLRFKIVSHGRQFMRFAGAVEPGPGYLMGSASAPLLRVPVSTLHDHPNEPDSPP